MTTILIIDDDRSLNELLRAYLGQFGMQVLTAVHPDGGYGLGLSLAKKSMTAHRGDLLLVSAPGEGSTFTLQFPL